MTETSVRSVRTPYILACVLVTILRLWLTHDMPVALLDHDVDDSLYLRHADALSRGEWLGDYDQNLLVKGPGYGAFLALAKRGGVPRRLAEDLLQVLAAGVAFWALRRAGLAAPLAVVAFAVLLLHPACLHGAATRVAREGVYYSQTLLILALGLAFVPRAPTWQRVVIAISLGAILAWSWQTRGEGVWFIPALSLCAFAATWLRRDHIARELCVMLASGLVIAGLVHQGNAWVASQNERHYGAAVTNELKDAPFNAAVGALQRVADADWSRYEPLRRSQRERLAELSPSFREVRPVLEQRIAASGPPTQAEGGELMGIFLSWALRDAAAESGYHASLPAARAFYDRLAAEVNAACDAGEIACGPPRSGQTPRFESSLLGTLLGSFVRCERELVAPEWIRLDEEPPLPLVLVSEEKEVVAEEVLGGDVVGTGVSSLRRRWSSLRILTTATRQGGMVLRVLGLLCVLGLAFTTRGRRHPLFWCAVVLEAALLTRAALVAGLETYWFRDVAIYLVPAAPLSPLVGLCAFGVFAKNPVRGSRTGWLTLVGVSCVLAVAVTAGDTRPIFRVLDDGHLIATTEHEPSENGDLALSREGPLSVHVVTPRRSSVDLTLDVLCAASRDVLTVEVRSYFFDGVAPRPVTYRRFVVPGVRRRLTVPIDILPAHPITVGLLESDGRGEVLAITLGDVSDAPPAPELDVVRRDDELVFTLEGGVPQGVYVAFLSRSKLARGAESPPLKGLAWLDPAGTVLSGDMPRRVVLKADEEGRANVTAPAEGVERGLWVQMVGEGGFSEATAVR